MATFSVMTWNLENLFRAGAESGPKTPAEYEEKLNSLASVIQTLAPDVLAVQEVGGEEPLADLMDALQGAYSHYQLSKHPDKRLIRVGFLSKLPIDDYEDISLLPSEGLPTISANKQNITKLGRGALRIQVRTSTGLAVHLITAHLKSKLLTFVGADGKPRFSTNDENERARVAGMALLQRTAEAVALRVKATEVLKHNPQDALIVLGDLNDVTDAATTQILQGPPGSEIGTDGFDRPDAGDATRLFNLAPCIPEARRFSRIHRGRGELIDHILVSATLMPGQPRRRPDVDSHVAIATALPSIADNPGERRGVPGSDHAPVMARFAV